MYIVHIQIEHGLTQLQKTHSTLSTIFRSSGHTNFKACVIFIKIISQCITSRIDVFRQIFTPLALEADVNDTCQIKETGTTLSMMQFGHLPQNRYAFLMFKSSIFMQPISKSITVDKTISWNNFLNKIYLIYYLAIYITNLVKKYDLTQKQSLKLKFYSIWVYYSDLKIFFINIFEFFFKHNYQIAHGILYILFKNCFQYCIFQNLKIGGWRGFITVLDIQRVLEY